MALTSSSQARVVQRKDTCDHDINFGDKYDDLFFFLFWGGTVLTETTSPPKHKPSEEKSRGFFCFVLFCFVLFCFVFLLLYQYIVTVDYFISFYLSD